MLLSATSSKPSDAAGDMSDGEFKLADVTRLIAIGSDAMMAAIARARGGALRPYLSPQHHAIASVNSPMQCMMKEICGQCHGGVNPFFQRWNGCVFLCRSGSAA